MWSSPFHHGAHTAVLYLTLCYTICVPDTSKKTLVLIVEDEKNLVDVLTKKFEVEGMEVVSAENGKIAIEKFEARLPDIVLLDLYMPVMDGHGFLKYIRGTEKGKNVPVLILSNMISRDFVMGAFDNKVIDYILKTSTTLDSVVDKVRKALS